MDQHLVSHLFRYSEDVSGGFSAVFPAHSVRPFDCELAAPHWLTQLHSGAAETGEQLLLLTPIVSKDDKDPLEHPMMAMQKQSPKKPNSL